MSSNVLIQTSFKLLLEMINTKHQNSEQTIAAASVRQMCFYTKARPRPERISEFLSSSYVKELLLRLNQVFELLDFSLQPVNLLFVGLPGNNINLAQRR